MIRECAAIIIFLYLIVGVVRRRRNGWRDNGIIKKEAREKKPIKARRPGEGRGWVISEMEKGVV
jgi:hypothetical protein